MAGSWQLTFCLLLTSLSVCCALYPQQKQRMKEQQTGISTRARVTLGDGLVLSGPGETLGQDRVKRKTTDCPVLETKGGRDLQKIIDADAVTRYSFFIQPQPGFNRLAFRLKLDNKWSSGSWKYSRESLIVSSSRLNIDWTHPTWIPVEVEYFKNDVSFGPDRHSLRVRVGNNVHEELITSWWRTHSYEGFTVEAEGPLKVFSKCHAGIAEAESFVDKGELSLPVLIAGILGGCFLLVVGAAIIYLVIGGRSHSQQDPQSNSPSVPTSLLRGRKGRENEKRDPIYESINEGTLAKLRKNFDVGILAANRTERENDHSSRSTEAYCENTKPILNLTACMPCHSSGIPNGGARDAQAASLLEQKQALRDCHGLNSPVESHYVEMHGIISRTSSFSK